MDLDIDYADFVCSGKQTLNRMFDYWADMINEYFPFQGDGFPVPRYLLANSFTPGEEQACLTSLLGSGLEAKIIHMTLVPPPVNDRSAAYNWADKETEMHRALTMAFFELPKTERKNVYGFIAIGDFVRFYQCIPAGEFKPIFFGEGKQTMHTVIDSQHITQTLKDIHNMWVWRDNTIPNPGDVDELFPHL